MLNSQIQEAINAINEMNPPISAPAFNNNEYVYSATFFNDLAAALNSII
jgi:hypothetical protein